MPISSNLISARALQSSIEHPGVSIIDCRFELSDPLAGRRAYLCEHIPGAVFADLDVDLAAPVTQDSGRHPLPDVETFATTLARLGISNSSDVIVYDSGAGALAARAWWLLRWLGHEHVRLLDGGIQQWSAEARPLVSGDEVVAAGDFSPRANHDKVVTTAELVSNLDAIQGMRLIDARDAARFRGEHEPIDPIAGHIPGSSNLPFPVSLKEDDSWKSRDELERLWLEVLGEDKEIAWAVMCGSGVTACHLAISAMEAGYSEPRLYVGSWSEWIRDPERPIALGDGRKGRLTAADMA